MPATGRNTIHYRRWRFAVLDRDKRTCQKCGATPRGKQLHAHHVKPWRLFPELRYEVENGITLCSGCHIVEDAIVEKAVAVTKGSRWTAEMRAEQSELMREFRAKHPITDECRRKISATLKGRPKQRTAEWNAKIAEARRGMKLGPQSRAHRRKLSLAQRGRVFSAEHRRKMSEAQRRRYGHAA